MSVSQGLLAFDGVPDKYYPTYSAYLESGPSPLLNYPEWRRANNLLLPKEEFHEPSMVEPCLNKSIQQIVEDYARGIPYRSSLVPQYDEGEGIEETRVYEDNMDFFSEMTELNEKIGESVKDEPKEEPKEEPKDELSE